jgi:hypothetical protein
MDREELGGVIEAANWQSKGINELDREQAGLLGQVLGAGPVAAFAGIERLGEEAADLVDEVLLGGVELLASGGLQIFSGHGNIVVRFAFITGLIEG